MKRLLIILIIFSGIISGLKIAEAENIPLSSLKEGDLIFFQGPNWIQNILTTTASGDSITHAAIVIKDKNGNLALLHALANGVVIQPLIPAINKEYYIFNQKLFARSISRPLTKEESEKLTTYAYEMEGKPFSPRKMLVPLDPTLMLRYPPFKSKPCITKSKSFTCSELVTESCIFAGLMSPALNPPGIYPYNLYSDSYFIPFVINKKLGIEKLWNPPKGLVLPNPKCPFPILQIGEVINRLKNVLNSYEQYSKNPRIDANTLNEIRKTQGKIIDFLTKIESIDLSKTDIEISEYLRNIIDDYFAKFNGELDPAKNNNGNVSKETAKLLRDLYQALNKYETCKALE